MTVRGSWAPRSVPPVCKSWPHHRVDVRHDQGIERGETVPCNGKVISGLTRHTACVERGDSGGANISTGGYALGLTAAASLPASGKCLSKIGQENRSWYQPIGEALSRNGLRLLTA